MGGFNRILFLVDRNNLAEQTLAEFQNYRTPGDGRRFTELYNVAKLNRGSMPDSTKVAIFTIQRVFKVPKNEDVSKGDDQGIDDFVPTHRSRWPTTPTCRRRRSTWSSSTRRTAASTASGAACWSTSTPTSSA